MRNEIAVDKLGVPLMSKILIRIEDIEDSFVTKGGVIAKSDFDKESWADSIGHSVSAFIPRHGEVVKMPRSINSFGWDYDTECEIQVGDIVYWNIIAFDEATILVCSGLTYVQMDYHKLLIRVRDGIVTPLNGNVLLMPVAKEQKALAYTASSKISDLWDIYQLPEKIPVSKISRRNGDVSMWEVGDRVKIMVNQAAMKVEGEINKSLDVELFCAPIWMCLCNVKKE